MQNSPSEALPKARDLTYCVIAVHWADSPGGFEFLAIDGQIVIFDTLSIAQETLPRLMAGRLHRWDAEKEILYCLDLSPGGFNRLAIWTGYDPYDVPNGFRARGVYSEAHGRDWRHHVLWAHTLSGLLAWADSFAHDALGVAP